MSTRPTFDLITMGRVSVDLYPGNYKVTEQRFLLSSENPAAADRRNVDRLHRPEIGCND